MSASGWNERFLTTSRGQIVKLLRATPRTVNDLAAAMGLTDNAVRAHLATLERDGLVRQSGQRRGVRKPHSLFGLTPAGEGLFPKAYGALLGELLDALADRLPPEDLDAILRDVGRRLAAAHRVLGDAALNDRLGAVLDVLAELGGDARVVEQDGRLFIQGDSCPLAAVVTGHPEACRLAEALVSEIAGVPARECCEKGSSPRCRFEFDAEDVAGVAGS